MAAPYSTAQYPYPPAMWDEAAEVLEVERGWSTILLVCPDIPGTESTAVSELAARGRAGVTALVVPDLFSGTFSLRVSHLTLIDPRWDDVEDHLKLHSPVALLVVDAISAGIDELALMDEARMAMAERGLNVSVGYSTDEFALEGLLRIEKV